MDQFHVPLATRAFTALAKIKTPLNQAYAFKMGVQGQLCLHLNQCVVCGQTGDSVGADFKTQKYNVVHCQDNEYCRDMASAILHVYNWYERHKKNTKLPRKETNWLFVEMLANSSYLSKLTFDMMCEQKILTSFTRETIRMEMDQNSKNLETERLNSPDDLTDLRLGDFNEFAPYIVVEESPSPVMSIQEPLVLEDDWIL